jgi:DNA-binding transcriptional ArsR family regulator
MTAAAEELLSSPRRRAILRLVWDRELAAGEIAAHADVTFGAVSQQLRLLREAGLVQVRGEGRRRLYRARRDAIHPGLAAWLQSTWRGKLDDLKRAAEAEERKTR